MTTKLDAIRQREQAATPGPWEAGTKVEGLYGLNGTIISQSATGGYVAADIAFGGESAAFIAHARADVPLLLAVVDAAAKVDEHVDYTNQGPGTPHDWCYEREEGTWPTCLANLRAALAPLLEPEG